MIYEKNLVKTILSLSINMSYIITRLIAIRNNNIDVNSYKDLENKHGDMRQKRMELNGTYLDYEVKSIYDFLMNDIKKFEFDFQSNRIEPFSLDQILDVNFYPDKENCPRITSKGYRTIKSAPAKGNISTEAIERAVKVVLSSPDIKN
jgi:hypothetical protein